MSENISPSRRWGAPLKIRDDEAPEMCRRRALAGALYGFLGGSAFALLAGTIDALILRDLSIYLDWSAVLLHWFGFGLVLAGAGAITGWMAEGLKGVMLGASSLALAMLVYSLIQANLALVAGLTMLVIMVLPVAATCLPIALVLRWLINRHTGESGINDKVRVRSVIFLAFLALILGLVPAFFTRTSGKAETSLRTMDTLLKNAASGQVDTRFDRQMEQSPALKAHIGMNYQLSQQTSIISTEGYEIIIVFADGFKATCTMVAYGSRDPYVSACVDGILGEQ